MRKKGEGREKKRMIEAEKEATDSVGLCELREPATTPRLIAESIIILAHWEHNQNPMCINKITGKAEKTTLVFPVFSWTRAKYRHSAEHSHSIMTQTMFH